MTESGLGTTHSGTTLSRIFVLPSSATRFVHLDMFRLLKTNHQSEIHLYCGTSQDLQFYETYRKSGVIDSVNQVCTLYQNIGAKKPGRDFNI